MMTPLQLQEDIKTRKANTKVSRKNKEDKAAFDMAEERRDFLKEHRRNSGIEEIWKAADKAYIPHTVQASASRKVLVSDDELGWRSAPVNLAVEDNWQEDSVSPNPYIKIQTALGIIVDQNPSAVLNAGAKKYEKTTILMKNLYENSWDIAHSKSALLKPLVFNSAKYGTGVGRTYPLNITRQVSDLKKFDSKNPSKNIYEDSEHRYYDDIFRESMSPWQAWFDDASVVGNPFSCNDVVYFKDYDWLSFSRNFGHLKNFNFVKPQERVLDKDGKLVDFDRGNAEAHQAKIQERVWFWENLEMDLLFIWTDGGIVLVNEVLPQKPKNKRLSVWSVPWTLRDDKSINGIGVYEAMRNDHKIHNKIRNMTIDQLVLSIYREWFYSGTDTLEGDGVMKTSPGKGRQVTDPKNVVWNEVPGPGQEAWTGLEHFDKRIDDATGISKSLQGEITGSTAFEISQARESALKRMKTPLENITDGLEKDAYISVGIIEDLYSLPRIRLLADDKIIDALALDDYVKISDTGDEVPLEAGVDYEQVNKEVPLNLEKKEDGSYANSDQINHLELRPEELEWEGVIHINGQSIVANSELLDRMTTVEMANLIVPLLSMPPDIAMKPAKELIKAYDKDYEDWLPETWLNPLQPQAPSMFMPQEQAQQMMEETPQKTGLETVTGAEAGGGQQRQLSSAIKNLSGG